MTRPRSVTLTAYLLSWFGVSALGAAVMGTLGTGPGLPLPTLLLGALFGFGLASLVAARAAWTLRPALSPLLLVVGGAGVLLSIAMPLALPSDRDPGNAWTAGLMGGALFALLCTWLSRRLRSLLGREE